jgi:hypothetical protein
MIIDKLTMVRLRQRSASPPRRSEARASTAGREMVFLIIDGFLNHGLMSQMSKTTEAITTVR